MQEDDLKDNIDETPEEEDDLLIGKKKGDLLDDVESIDELEEDELEEDEEPFDDVYDK
ncbi:hypothetical protein GW944_00880 [Candidatus Parcubacteria bacterium]|nr:hypothetical protein [Candidatus Parcubacteria bacterium]